MRRRAGRAGRRVGEQVDEAVERDLDAAAARPARTRPPSPGHNPAPRGRSRRSSRRRAPGAPGAGHPPPPGAPPRRTGSRPPLSRGYRFTPLVDPRRTMQYHACPCMNVQPTPSSPPSAARRSSPRSSTTARSSRRGSPTSSGVSEDTIRRDLRELAAQGLVQRVHGGALPPAPQPGSFAHRIETRPGAKAALAEAGVAVLGRGARRAARRLDDEPRARPPAARRAAPHRADQLPADRRRARRPPDRRGGR